MVSQTIQLEANGTFDMPKNQNEYSHAYHTEIFLSFIKWGLSRCNYIEETSIEPLTSFMKGSLSPKNLGIGQGL